MIKKKLFQKIELLPKLIELGYEVDSFEPDYNHYEIAQNYLRNSKKNTLYNLF